MRAAGSLAFAALCAPALLIIACGCSRGTERDTRAATAGFSPASSASPVAAKAPGALLAFAARIGVTCDMASGKLACIGGRPEVGDYADITLQPGCTAASDYAIVDTPSPIELRDKISPLDTKTIATLDRGTPVCIQAIGLAGSKPFYYFVTAMPVEYVAACMGNDACVGAGVHWVSRNPPAPCQPHGTDVLKNCASGWMWSDDVSRL